MRKLIAALAMSAATLTAFVATPAHAATVIHFSATAQLDTFPDASTNLNGDLQSASISGVTGTGVSFSANESPADQTFAYSEGSCATGSADANGVNGTPAIKLDDGGTLSFTYTRVGAVAHITATYANSGTGVSADFQAVGVFTVNTVSTLASECAGTPGPANVTVTGAGASTSDV